MRRSALFGQKIGVVSFARIPEGIVVQALLFKVLNTILCAKSVCLNIVNLDEWWDIQESEISFEKCETH